jgi:hypothetical protein
MFLSARRSRKNIDHRPTAGGGFDIYARAVGKAMENYLPKNVRVVVRNIPGAGSVKGIATMYRAAPDGYTMGIVDLPGAVAPQIMGEQLPYDLDKATWLGTVNIGVYCSWSAKSTSFPTLDAPGKPAAFSRHRSFSPPPAAMIWPWRDRGERALASRRNFDRLYWRPGCAPCDHIRGEADVRVRTDVAIRAPSSCQWRLAVIVVVRKETARAELLRRASPMRTMFTAIRSSLI